VVPEERAVVRPRGAAGRPGCQRGHAHVSQDGGRRRHEADGSHAFLEQAKEYEESGGPLDRIFQILNTLERSHPFNTLRAAELQRWIEAGQYERILNGEYTRRGPDAENRPIDKDIRRGPRSLYEGSQKPS